MKSSASLIQIHPGCLRYLRDTEILDLVTLNTFTESRKVLLEYYAGLECDSGMSIALS